MRGAVAHMLRVLLDNLETKARTYKSKVRPGLGPSFHRLRRMSGWSESERAGCPQLRCMSGASPVVC